MSLNFLQQHWALIVAGVVGTLVLLFAGWRAWLDSPRGRLFVARRRLRDKGLEARRQHKQLVRLSTHLESLQSKADSVKPRRLQEATEAAQDARALLKIAKDQVLIAENHVRKIIVEEFPPQRHERLRSRYLPGERADGKPFTF
jgi:hypothetical protein